MSLTSRLQALLTYANEKTEAGDTTIGAAIKTLCDGYSGASGSVTYPTITDADTLSSRIQALIAYADETTGEADATLSAAIKRLVDGYGSVLPSGYTECEYLQSSGKQYINTLQTCETTQCTLHIKASITSGRNGYVSKGMYRFYFGRSATYWMASNSKNYNHTISGADDDVHQFDLTQNGLSVDDVLIYSSSMERADSNPIYLFGICDAQGTFQYAATELLYGASLIDNENCKFNFIPCLDADGKPCLYDTVSKQPFYNKGTGTFGYKTKAGVVANPT